MSDELKPLSRKHQRVMDEYLKCWRQAEAYQKIYKVPWASAKSASSVLFANDNFSAHLQARLDEIHMSANEALKLQADIARGDMGEFLDTKGIGFSLDLQDAKGKGLTKLIKKVKQKTTTFIAKKESEEDREVHELEIELYPADVAQERILKIHGKLKGDAPVVNIVKGYKGWTPDNWDKDKDAG